ncbi:Lsr2 family protein [Catellatospora sp. KI3]|uniref:histone-like nucleoid-structuring protein Lsr2 n=1 Tax=Catellatospora sp. KI3 TaxID=3041620 RepID=UPI002482DFE0|nr:Lsr2 family protein [Catellatospora sp. KI3]MDI1465112.1 Lsr2 family protein [Catellatospora sp. KI3]
MARREIVVLADDLDGSEGDVRSVKFGFEGNSYEIDLGPANHDKLALALAPFVAAARKESSRRGPAVAAKAKAPTAAEQRAFNQRVREWAKGQGEEVNDRGRVPAKLIEKYFAAGLR